MPPSFTVFFDLFTIIYESNGETKGVVGSNGRCGCKRYTLICWTEENDVDDDDDDGKWGWISDV